MKYIKLLSLLLGIFVLMPDATGKNVKAETTVIQPADLTMNTSAVSAICDLAVVGLKTDITCFEESNGTITLDITGGVAPYSVLWSNGSTGPYIEGLPEGDYSAIVTDANGCTVSANYTLTGPTLLSVAASQTNISCLGANNGTASVNITGGTPPYSVQWSDGSTGTSISGLAPDYYAALVTDANGCVFYAEFTLTEPTTQPVAVTASQTDVSCFGGNNGTASLDITAGAAPYAVQWSNGSTNTSISGLSAGNYTAVVTDASGCSVSVNVSVSQPAILTLTIDKTDITCAGDTGTATAHVTGGTPPYAYNWVGLPETSATAALSAGTWTVIITDANGCSVSGTVTIGLLPCDGYVSVTQSGWSKKCNKGNLGCYRDEHFASAFPGGLTVGACGRFLQFTSSFAVQNFLPSTGTSKALNSGTLINPATNKNSLAGQTVALALTLGFDASDPNFAPAANTLGNLIITSGVFAGWTVNQLLAEANKALGGCSAYSPSVLTNALDAVNRNYDNNADFGFLSCPCSPDARMRNEDGQSAAETNTNVELISLFSFFPNPAIENSTIEFSVSKNSSAKVEVFTSMGQLVEILFSGNVNADQNYNIPFNTVNFSRGIYFVKLSTDAAIQTKQVVILK